MWVVIWLSLGLLATLFTFAWVLGRERIYIKASISLASWALVAITAGDLFTLDDTGKEIALEVGSIRYFAAGLAVLSFIVLLLYRFDEYPPRREGAR